MQVLNVVDTSSLAITLTTHWVNYNFLPPNKNFYLCRVILFIATQCLDFGACINAAMTIDRAIAIAKPLQHRYLCVRPLTIGVISAIGILTFLKNSYTFYVAGFNLKGKNKHCTPQYAPDEWFSKVYPYFDLLIGSIGPFFIIFTCNVIIIIQLKKTTPVPNNLNKIKEAKKQRQLTMMLLLISTTFLLFTLPRKVFTIVYANMAPVAAIEEKANYILGQAITTKLWHLNSAVNIWLCLLSGRRFRSDVYKVITCGWWKKSNMGTESTTSGTGGSNEQSRDKNA